MKNIKTTFGILAIGLLALTVSCKDNKETEHHEDMYKDGQHHDSIMTDESDAHMMNDETAMYSCPMHPEVHGNMHDKCSECGMELEMTNSKTTEEKK